MERVVSIILLGLVWPSCGLAKTWEVRKTGGLNSIGAAVRSASPGDTIKVFAGVYLEKGLVIDKRLCLIGIGMPVLDGEGRYEIVLVKADGVTFQGFVLRHSGYSGWNDIAGIHLAGVRGVKVLSNRLDDTFFGLYCQNSDSCVLSGNILVSRAAMGGQTSGAAVGGQTLGAAVGGQTSGAAMSGQAGNGIHCWHCSHMRILDNTISRHRDGIYFEFVTESLIRGNNSAYNVRYGLHFMFSHNDAYEGNTFRHNEAGVSVMFSHGVDMRGNVFADNLGGGAYGILLKEISDGRIESNRFLHNTIAIYMEGTTRVQINRNLFSGNGWAIKVQASCSEDTISANNFVGNTFDIATNGTLVLNFYDRNYWDKYEGYDIDRDGIGDIPYHPVSLYAMIAEKNPAVMMLYHSLMVSLLDRTEKVVPSITPVNLVDRRPLMKPLAL
ncbi:MAG TPA: nitrous oxide reductase family maturation protein NosD [Puia sp.]|jgi:nitrous oxidase accessory protein|nr:nitrous oxide reductase family maturation protein NosD [Puia sp.]